MTLPTDVEYFEPILKHLEQTRGFDFTAYKPTSLMRRLVRRMQMVNVGSFEQYLDLLQVDNEEFTALFNTILINVTSFFRDKDVWDTLAAEILPKVFSDRNPALPFRVWSAGSASGQEAYSIVMLLAEQLGPDIVREHVKVYATDLDEDALLEARQATYSARQVQGVPANLLEKYFDRSGDSFRLQSRPAARGNLRTARPGAGRTDLAARPPDLPQHVDVLQRGRTGADPGALLLLAEPGGADSPRPG